MTLSEQQRVALAVVPKVSSVFSLFGSIWIIVEVATEPTKRGVPYHRLLLAMSVYDVLESVWNFASTWPIPEGSPDVIWAFGNTATCTAQGFFLTLSSAVPLYNAMLSWYYVLVINYNYSDTKLRGFVEPAMHIFCFVWAFGTALTSAVAGLINNADLWCWIAPLPSDCKDSWTHGSGPENDNPCIRGDNVWIYRFGFYFIPLWISIAVATISTYMVWKYVFIQDKKTLRYRRPERKMEVWRTGMKSIRNLKKRFSPAAPVSVNSNLGQIAEEAEEEHDDENEKAKETHPSSSSRAKDRNSDEAAQEPASKLVRDVPGAKKSSFSSDHGNESPASRSSVGTNLSASNRKEASSLGLGPLPEDFEGASTEGESSLVNRLSQERPKLEDNTPHNLKNSMREFSQERQPTGAWSISMRSQMSNMSESSIKTVDSADVSAAQAELAKRKSRIALQARSMGRLDPDSSMRSIDSEGISAAQDEIARRKQREEQEELAQSERLAAAQNRKGLLTRWREWKEKREQYARDMPHTVEVFHQACFYLGAFYCTHVWSTTNRIVQTIAETNDSVFFLLVMHAFFDPFQGFLNFLVYQRPRFIQMVKKFPNLSYGQICLIILRFSYMGEYVMTPAKDKSSTEASD